MRVGSMPCSHQPTAAPTTQVDRLFATVGIIQHGTLHSTTHPPPPHPAHHPPARLTTCHYSSLPVCTHCCICAVSLLSSGNFPSRSLECTRVG